MNEKTLFSRIRLASSPLMIMMMVMALFLLAGTAQAAEHGGESETEILMQTLYQGANLALLLGTLFYFGRKPITEFFSTRRSGSSLNSRKPPISLPRPKSAMQNSSAASSTSVPRSKKSARKPADARERKRNGSWPMHERRLSAFDAMRRPR